MRKRSRTLWLIVLSTALIVFAGGVAPADTCAPVNWPMGGFDYSGNRSNPYETAISPSNAADLAVKWTFTTHGDVSANPAVDDGVVYFPDWGGYLNAVDASTGQLVWQTKISGYTGISGDFSRTSPAVSDGVVYVGDYNGGQLLAINAYTGALLWKSTIDSSGESLQTQSPIVYGGIVYEGVSSTEAVLASNPSYPCCTHRGSITATLAGTGQLLWRTYTVPSNGGEPGGYSGGAIWGGTPTLDPATGTLYVSTGQNYTIPASATACENTGAPASQCLSPGDHIDSVIALNMYTGQVKWANGAGQYDTWNLACVEGSPTNCPPDAGHDYDFSDGTHLFSITGPHGLPEQVVGAGSKSGTYWLFNATTGSLVWSTNIGPGSDSGGILWGTSYDGTRIYAAESDNAHQTVDLPGGATTTNSAFAALNPQTGAIEWEVPDPTGAAGQGAAWGAVTSADGVMFASDSAGYMYAIDGATGQILWSYKAPFAVNAGATIVNGNVYWGDGYSEMATGSTTTGTFYDFSINGK